MTRILSRATFAGTLLLVALTAAACGQASGAQPASAGPVDPDAVKIVASGQSFVTADVAAPAGRPFQISFESRTGDPHDIAIGADGSDPVFRSDVYSGPGTTTFQVPALAAGTYTFKCDVHPGMTGTITVR
jgi:plastocyanin